MDHRADLLQRAAAFCERTGKSKSSLARAVLNDAKFFDRVEGRGGGFTVKTYERFLRHFREHEREDAA